MKVRKISIVVKTFILTAALLFAGTNVLGYLAYNRGKDSLYQQIQSNAVNIASCAAANVDGDILNTINIGDEKTEAYDTIISQLSLFRDNAEIEYIYTLKLESDGTIVYMVDSDTEEPAAIGDECESTPMMQMSLETSATTVDDEFIEDEWGTHLSAYSPVFASNGSIVGAVGVDISADWVTEQMLILRNTMLIVAAVMFVVILAGLGLLMFSFRKSLCKLNNKVRDLVSGDGDLTKSIDIKSGDELETIAQNMNEFINQIRSLVAGVSKSSEAVRKTGDEVNQNVVMNTDVVLDMSSQTQEISASMQQSAASAQVLSETLSSSAENVKAFVSEVNQLKGVADESSKQVAEFANKSQTNRENTLENIAKLQQRMAEISEGVKRIELIREIASEVAAIAKQTNMLSLNAQIEAARAGKMGMGFAVVATQVGKLSVDINRAVVEVNSTSEQIFEATNALSEVSDDLMKFISTQVVSDYDEFAKISVGYGEVSEDMKIRLAKIADEGIDVSKGIMAVDEQVQGISQMVNVTSESTVHLATAISQMSHSMEDLSRLAKQNAEQTECLNSQIGKYKF